MIDPMGNKRQIIKYDRAVAKQFDEFVIELKKMLGLADDAPYDEIVDNFMILLDEKITAPLEQTTLDYVKTTAAQGAHGARINLEQMGIIASVGVLPVDPKVLNILNQRNIGALKGITDDMAKRFKETMSDVIMKGESVPQAAKRVSEDIGISKNRARTMVRTETSYAFNSARLNEFRKYDVQKVRWFTARDERTCTRPINVNGKIIAGCKSLHDKVFDIDKVPPCPLHPNCRCVVLAEVAEVE